MIITKENAISKSLDKSILIANAIDHFDTSLYGFLTIIIADTFFDNKDPIIRLILAYSFMSTYIITRPLGAIIFGNIAKRKSVSYALSCSLLGLGFFTFMIGVIPSYKSIGIFSPILLLVVRMVRGVFAAGESAIAKICIVDNKNDIDGMKSSYQYNFSSMIGIITASIVSSFIIFAPDIIFAPELLKSPELWRLCFIFGGIITLLTYFLRYDIDRHDTYDDLKYTQNFSNYRNIFAYKKEFLKISLTTGFSYLTYSFPFIIMNTLIPYITDIRISRLMIVNSYLLIFDAILIPIFGKIFKSMKSIIFSLVILLVTVPIMFYFMPGKNIYYVSFVRMWIVFWGVMFMCPQNFYYNKIVKGKDKYLIVPLSSAIGGGLFGKLTPFICTTIWYYTNDISYIGLYFFIIGLLTYISIKS